MDLVVAVSVDIDVSTRATLRGLRDRAFGDRFSEQDAEHAFGGVHVLMRDEDRLVGHASAVARRLRFGHAPWRTVGYVEGVATDPERQREGIGRAVMQRLHGEIAPRWPVALLSTGRATPSTRPSAGSAGKGGRTPGPHRAWCRTTSTAG